MLNTINDLFLLSINFKVCLLFKVSTMYQQLQIKYINISGIVIILYCSELKKSPFNKHITELVNPQPGHGILNRLYIRQILMFDK